MMLWKAFCCLLLCHIQYVFISRALISLLKCFWYYFWILSRGNHWKAYLYGALDNMLQIWKRVSQWLLSSLQQTPSMNASTHLCTADRNKMRSCTISKNGWIKGLNSMSLNVTFLLWLIFAGDLVIEDAHELSSLNSVIDQYSVKILHQTSQYWQWGWYLIASW